jgi:hypothetical protein
MRFGERAYKAERQQLTSFPAVTAFPLADTTDWAPVSLHAPVPSRQKPIHGKRTLTVRTGLATQKQSDFALILL